jgi:hypothetical protein
VSSPFLHESPDDSAAVPEANDTRGVGQPSGVTVTVIVQNRHTFETRHVTGRQIKARAGVPAGFALYRRVQGGNEPIADDSRVKLHNGDHFFARPPLGGS